jgi:hypothetical protein
MSKDLIGTETWECVRYALTPRMRREILLTVAEIYAGWLNQDYSWEWSVAEQQYGQVDAHPVATVDDFLSELTDVPDPRSRRDRSSYRDELYEWQRDFYYEEWGDDIYEPDDDTGDDPFWVAELRVCGWLEGLRVDDVAEWYEEHLNPKCERHWSSAGF